MSRFQQGSILKLKRKSGPDVRVFRWYDESSGSRTYKKRTLGTVAEMPQKRDAEKAVASFRANINTGVRVPETVSDLIAHYLKHELTADKKAYATIEATTIYLARHIGPNWGAKHLSDVRPWKSRSGCIRLSTLLRPRAKSATSCRPCSIMPSGMSGSIGTPSPRFGLPRNVCGNRMYCLQVNSQPCLNNYPFVKRRW